MPASKAHIKATNKWMAKAYDRINLTVPKGRKDSIQAHASTHGESVNGFIGRAIVETMERDESETPPTSPQEAAGRPAGAGGISLPPDVLRAAQEAAEVAGEPLENFMTRAVATQAQQDKAFLRMGFNPVTGDKLEKEA